MISEDKKNHNSYFSINIIFLVRHRWTNAGMRSKFTIEDIILYKVLLLILRESNFDVN